VTFFVLAIPTELSGGRYPAPAWLILALGGVVVVGASIFLTFRFLRSKDKR
jgi:hypothetical protein